LGRPKLCTKSCREKKKKKEKKKQKKKKKKKDQITKNEMGGVCSTYVVEEGCIRGFGGNLMERERLEDQGVDGRVILIWIFKK